jgi:hypothetical protein
MPPIAAHRACTVSVRSSLANHRSGAAASRLVVRPPRIVALDQEHQQRALDALSELLAILLDPDHGTLPSWPNPVP